MANDSPHASAFASSSNSAPSPQRQASRPQRLLRRDQPRRLEVGAAVLIFVFTSASGRLLGPAPSFDFDVFSAGEQLQQWSRDVFTPMDGLLTRLRRRRDNGDSGQPEFAGSWRTSEYDNLDEFLDRAMGVGYFSRAIATKASQTQRLWQKGEVVHLEISDRRGTARYTLRPDGRTHGGFGFMKLPIKQKAKWGRDGALLVEERYPVHLGGDEHEEKCSGDACPVIRSRRSLDRATGMMLVELERTLLSGDVVKTRTYYRPHTES